MVWTIVGFLLVGGAGPRMLHSNHTYDLEKFTKKHASSLFIVLLQANFYSFYMPICYYKQFVMGSELNMHGPYYLHILAIHIKLYSLAYYYDAIDLYI